jgi:hypothetical protein
MTSPARVLQTNNDAIRRVQHLSEAAVLLWPDAPDLAQYYLYVARYCNNFLNIIYQI